MRTVLLAAVLALAAWALRYWATAAWLKLKRCGTCSMFRPKLLGQTGACTLVAGFIRASDVCDRWEPKR